MGTTRNTTKACLVIDAGTLSFAFTKESGGVNLEKKPKPKDCHQYNFLKRINIKLILPIKVVQPQERPTKEASDDKGPNLS